MLGAGLLVILPIGITLLVLKFFFDLLDPILRQPLEFLPGPYIIGSGLAALVVALYLIGLITSHVVGRRLIEVGHLIIERIPLVKIIYSTTRSGVELLSGSKDSPYRGAVLVEFPRPGMKSIGLVTSSLEQPDGEEMVFVYIPTTPVPSSGFLVVVGIKDVTPLDMSVDDAMKIIISGGILAGELFTPPASADWTKSSSAPDAQKSPPLPVAVLEAENSSQLDQEPVSAEEVR
jgi:uncharacterized membrane protein